MSFLRDMVTRVCGEPVENLQPNVIVDPDNSTYIMHVNSDGSITTSGGGVASSVAINDGTTTSQKASVSAGGALKVDNSGVTQPVSGTFWQATQPVSNASLPLPTGAATEAGHLATIDSVQGAAGDSNSTNTVMGRLTKIRDLLLGFVFDNTDRLKTSLYVKTSAAADTLLTLGQSTKANSLPVTLASDQDTLAIKRNCALLYSTTQTTISATGDSGDIVWGQYTNLLLIINITAITSGTITFKTQAKDNFGNYDSVHIPTALSSVTTTAYSVGVGNVTASNSDFGLSGKIQWAAASLVGCSFQLSVYGK